MPEYSKEELARLIEQYNRQLMTQYANEQTDNTPPPSPPVPSPEPVATEKENNPLTDIGQLQIRVSTENQTFPIVGAVVAVTHTQNTDNILDRTLITDQNGLTDIIDLPTKDRTLSLSPDNPMPYTTYNIRVTADGYFTKDILNMPIYGGVTAIQSVSMIPLPEGSDSDIPLVVSNYQTTEE